MQKVGALYEGGTFFMKHVSEKYQAQIHPPLAHLQLTKSLQRNW
jgi:hypothetical protein